MCHSFVSIIAIFNVPFSRIERVYLKVQARKDELLMGMPWRVLPISCLLHGNIYICQSGKNSKHSSTNCWTKQSNNIKIKDISIL